MPLSGKFCANCGQLSKETKRPFLRFIEEILHTVFELDGRAYKSVFFLFTRPAFLSSEYVAGRRASYTPPLRLFLVLSISFFLLLSLSNSIAALRSTLAGEIENPEAALLATQLESDNQIATADDIDGVDQEELDEIFALVENIRFPFLTDASNERLQTFFSSQIEINLQKLVTDPEEFLSSSLDYITVFMLILMPILAFIQFVLYATSRRYYVEHFVLILHNQTFLILSFGLIVIMGFIQELAIPVVSIAFNYLSTILGFWIAIYLFLSLKIFFRQGYAITTVKFLTAGFIYGICIGGAMVVSFLLLFILS